MPEAQLGLGDRHQSPCFGIIRIKLDSLLADARDGFIALDVTESAADPLLPGHKIEPVGLGVGRAALFDGLLLFRQKLELQCRDDRVRNLVLDYKDVSQVPIVALRPQMPARITGNRAAR